MKVVGSVALRFQSDRFLVVGHIQIEVVCICIDGRVDGLAGKICVRRYFLASGFKSSSSRFWLTTAPAARPAESRRDLQLGLRHLAASDIDRHRDRADEHDGADADQSVRPRRVRRTTASSNSVMRSFFMALPCYSSQVFTRDWLMSAPRRGLKKARR